MAAKKTTTAVASALRVGETSTSIQLYQENIQNPDGTWTVLQKMENNGNTYTMGLVPSGENGDLASVWILDQQS
jgi:hypothetical protein